MKVRQPIFANACTLTATAFIARLFPSSPQWHLRGFEDAAEVENVPISITNEQSARPGRAGQNPTVALEGRLGPSMSGFPVGAEVAGASMLSVSLSSLTVLSTIAAVGLCVGTSPICAELRDAHNTGAS